VELASVRVEARAATDRHISAAAVTISSGRAENLAGGASNARTGAPGRPSSMHLIRQEHERRLAAGEAQGAVSAEAAKLAYWFVTNHPNLPRAGRKAIENAIRATHRRLRESRAEKSTL
jgi:hypothetical protein